MKLPRAFYNWTSIIGSVIAGVSFFMILFLIAVSLFIEITSSYLGLVIYIILPIFLVLGLILIPVGMMRERKKISKFQKGDAVYWPRIDLNIRQHRNAFSVFVISTVVFLFFSAIGTYEAFHFTESTRFCGEVCHKVMHPEFIAYQSSAHANVACVDCHVGSGANWYMRSKLSGLYQVYSVTFKKYPQPIPTPIHNLRPARETCERCHWPEQFYPNLLRTEKHYLADELNSEWDILLKMNIGSEYHALGQEEGSHWHINPDVRIEYIPESGDRLTIPWVRYTNLESGESVTYTQEDYDPVQEFGTDGNERLMDCMDCHNRPSHEFLAPPFFTDMSITRGDIPGKLVDVKQVAMGILYNNYPSTDTAMIAIENEVREYYDFMHPEILENDPAMVERAIEGIQADYRENIFPEMKARWDVYPNHLGHINTEGCHRCHDDRHRSEEGRVISRDCNLCHTIIGQGHPGKLSLASVRDTLEFIHPVDIGEAWKEFHCVECHRYLY